MPLTSKFSIDGAETIDGELVNPANWQNAFVNLAFDKDSVIAKSKGVVSITEWEWISKTAKFLSNYQKDGLTGGHGVLIGVPFQWELTDDGGRSVIFNGYLDLSGATFECDKVTTPSRERTKIDDLNSKVDSFTYEYLLSQGLLSPTDYTYVPYAKLPVQNLGLEIVVSTIQLIILIIELQAAITELVKLIVGLATFTWADLFKAVIQTVYTAFLTLTIANAVSNILKLIIQPIKYHAGMTELRLMQVGADYLGYEFASSILEEDYPTAVIIPEKWNIQTQEDDDLVTGYTTVASMAVPIDLNTSNHLEQNGYYNGTFGDVIRALKIKYNAKVIIEDSTTGGLPILRFERDDYIADISALYEIPAIENNERFTLNSDEFKANYLIEYQLDSTNKACYTSYGGTVYQSTVTPNITIPDNIDLNLMKGFDNRLIPFAKGVRKNSLTKVEETMQPILNVVINLVGTIILTVNVSLAIAYLGGYAALSSINLIIDAVNGLPLGLNIPLIDVDALLPLDEIPFVAIPNLLEFAGDRIGVMQVENDFLNIPHNIILNNFAGQFADDPDSVELDPLAGLASQIINYGDVLNNQGATGDFFGNRLIENHNFEIGAKNLFEKFHYINSFVPTDVADTDDNPLTPQLHNQWKLYEFENVPFCYEDYLKVKSNNNIIFADKVGRIESLEWDVYNQTAKISFRVNELWTANLKVQNNEPIGR